LLINKIKTCVFCCYKVFTIHLTANTSEHGSNPSTRFSKHQAYTTRKKAYTKGCGGGFGDARPDVFTIGTWRFQSEPVLYGAHRQSFGRRGNRAIEAHGDKGPEHGRQDGTDIPAIGKRPGYRGIANRYGVGKIATGKDSRQQN